jgi:hypothetical protein
MPAAFRSVASVARLAQVRMMFFEDSANGGLRLRHRQAELADAKARCSQWSRLVTWADWYDHAVASRVMGNHNFLLKRGVLSENIISKLCPLSLRLVGKEEIAPLRRKLAVSVNKGLARTELPHPHYRVREKLERWKLPGTPRVVADRFLRHIAQLGHLVPPRVIAAVFSTAWNRWCTARRFQHRNRACNHCRLGCGGGAEDSIEHYSRCRAVREFHATVLNLQDDWLLPFWLGTHNSQGNDADLLACGAIGAFAVYSVTNVARHGGSFSHAEAKHALGQAAKEATLGHGKALRILSSRWIRPAGARRATPATNL